MNLTHLERLEGPDDGSVRVEFQCVADLAGRDFRIATSMPSEWVKWHQRYDDDLLSPRLKVVQQCIRDALDGSTDAPYRVVSLCAGDGRDLLGALRDHRRARDVRARLVDVTPELVMAGRDEVSRLGLPSVSFVLGDASTTDAFAGAVPAHLVLVCGVFGNISDRDVRNTIDHLPELCAPDATVVWTRGRFEPDLTPTIREWFREAGFTELSFTSIPGTTASVGAHRLAIPARPFVGGVRLFTFLPKEERPSSRARARSDLDRVKT